MYNLILFITLKSMKKNYRLLIGFGCVGLFVAVLQLARGKELKEVYYPLFIGLVHIGSSLIERKKHLKK
jgi:hypothetical protein